MGISIWYLIPSIILETGSSTLYVFLVSMLLSYFVGVFLGTKYTIKQYRLPIGNRLFTISFGVVSFFVYFGIAIMIKNYGGLSSIFSGNARNYYYQGQFNLSTSRFIIAKYVGILFLVYVLYGGISWDRLSGFLRKSFLVTLALISYLKFALGSRLFVLYALIFLVGRSYKYQFSRLQIYMLLASSLVGLSVGSVLRYGSYDIETLFSIFRATENLNFVLGLEGKTNLSSFFYDLSFIPSSLFDYELPNLTLLKHGSLKGSSEPMPVLASMYYGMKDWSFLYMTALGYFAGLAYRNFSRSPLSFFYLFALMYVFLLYLTHSPFRATNRLAVLCIHFQLINFVIGGLCRRTT